MASLLGATALILAMGFTGRPRALAEYLGGIGLSTFSLLMALMVFYIIPGMFLDGISSVVLARAIVQPMVTQAGIDLIWFGIFIMIAFPELATWLSGTIKNASAGGQKYWRYRT